MRNIERRHRLQGNRTTDRVRKSTQPPLGRTPVPRANLSLPGGRRAGLWGSRGYARKWYQPIRSTPTALTKPLTVESENQGVNVHPGMFTCRMPGKPAQLVFFQSLCT